MEERMEHPHHTPQCGDNRKELWTIRPLIFPRTLRLRVLPPQSAKIMDRI